jgi:hypothetical protein
MSVDAASSQSPLSVGAAGEHYVAMRLNMLGVDTGLVPAGNPTTDVLAHRDGATASIQVKANRGRITLPQSDRGTRRASPNASLSRTVHRGRGLLDLTRLLEQRRVGVQRHRRAGVAQLLSCGAGPAPAARLRSPACGAARR